MNLLKGGCMNKWFLIGLAVGVGMISMLALTPREGIQFVLKDPVTNFRTYQVSITSTSATEIVIPDANNIRRTGIDIVNTSQYIVYLLSSTATTVTNGYQLTTTSGTCSTYSINTTKPIYALITPLGGAETAATGTINFAVKNYD
jgi:hypothetical protein